MFHIYLYAYGGLFRRQFICQAHASCLLHKGNQHRCGKHIQLTTAHSLSRIVGGHRRLRRRRLAQCQTSRHDAALYGQHGGDHMTTYRRITIPLRAGTVVFAQLLSITREGERYGSIFVSIRNVCPPAVGFAFLVLYTTLLVQFHAAFDVADEVITTLQSNQSDCWFRTGAHGHAPPSAIPLPSVCIRAPIHWVLYCL